MNNMHEVIEAKWIQDYTVCLIFNDRRKGTIDLKPYLGRGIFKELLNLEKFKRFKVDTELGTIVWPNGADIDPEVLYRQVFARKISNRLPKAA